MKKISLYLFLMVLLVLPITYVGAASWVPDPNFNTEVFSQTPTDFAFQSDGKLILVGNFDSYGDESVSGIVRLNTNGTIDTTFNAGGNGFGAINNILKVEVDSNDKILIGGFFGEYNGETVHGLVRLNADGSIDESFNSGGDGFDENSGATGLLTLQNGKIIVSGFLNEYNASTSIPNIIRLNSDGSLDDAFNSVVDSDAQYIIERQDGSVLFGGGQVVIQSGPKTGIASLDPDGLVDSDFIVTGTGFSNYTQSINIDNTGKIIAVGFFDAYGGVNTNRIARLNIDGTLDQDFGDGVGFAFSGGEAIPEEVAFQDDKILVIGQFDSYDGNSSNHLVRLNNDGSFDDSFDIGTGFSSFGLYHIFFDEDNEYIYFIHSNPGTFNGLPIKSLGRLILDGDAPVPQSFNANGADITIQFNEYLKENYELDTSMFVVKVNAETIELTSAWSNGDLYLQSLSSPIEFGDIVTVSYIQPISEADRLQDSAGNFVDNFTDIAVTNNTAQPESDPEPTPEPVVTSSSRSGTGTRNRGGGVGIVTTPLTNPRLVSMTPISNMIYDMSSLWIDSSVATKLIAILKGLPLPVAPTPPESLFSGTWKRSLTVNSEGLDVFALQKFLNEKGFIITNEGPGSPGNETLKFGDFTRDALAKFQGAHGIPATGYFGPETRVFLNQLMSN